MDGGLLSGGFEECGNVEGLPGFNSDRVQCQVTMDLNGPHINFRDTDPRHAYLISCLEHRYTHAPI